MRDSKVSKQIREIRIIDIFKYFVLSLILIVAVWIAYSICIKKIDFHWWVFLIAAIVLTYILLRYFLIGLVLLYKAFAPLSVRGRCRFEPTCSTYMIMAIKKYGVLVGVIKGIRRIFRCKPPNGGVDYP